MSAWNIGKTFLGSSAMAALAIAVAASPASAIPRLQLDVQGTARHYDNATDTWVADSDVFTIRAYLTTGSNEASEPWLSRDYYLSVALMPKLTDLDPTIDYGSFTIGGITTNVGDDTQGWQYGTPPVDNYVGNGDASLAPHGIFATWFNELSFNFDAKNVHSPAINTMPSTATDDPGDGTADSVDNPASQWYQDFSFDISGLHTSYDLHFDLYAKAETNAPNDGDDLDATPFAPFSHDAESGTRGGGTPPPVPEPGAVVLLGIGAVSMFARKRFPLL
jgi:hypothetical protein